MEPPSITSDSDFLFKSTFPPIMPSISRACRAVVMLGPSGAGKSNLFSRFIHDKFNPDSEVTIGVDFASKVMETFDGVKVKTQLWDTGTCCPLHTLFTSVVYGGNIAVCDAAGQEKYRAMTSAYYRNAQGALLVYDITSRESFEGIQSWLTELRSHRGKDMIIMLVGNKLDLEDRRKVVLADALAFADKNDLAFMETSALTDVGVAAAFTSVIQEVYRMKRKQLRLEKEERRRKEAEEGKTRTSSTGGGAAAAAGSPVPSAGASGKGGAPASTKSTKTVDLATPTGPTKAKPGGGGCCDS